MRKALILLVFEGVHEDMLLIIRGLLVTIQPFFQARLAGMDSMSYPSIYASLCRTICVSGHRGHRSLKILTNKRQIVIILKEIWQLTENVCLDDNNVWPQPLAEYF